MMISSAQEFVALRSSKNPAEYSRAANERAPIEVWRQVIQDFPSMRQWVAHNKTIPVDILSILARDRSVKVRVSIAMKNKLSMELMQLLADDPSEVVRDRIAHNRAAPRAIVERLSHDPCKRIAKKARTRLKNWPRNPLFR